MSNLLSQASLVMIPSGYKEDVVYSQIPTNGNGDLSFTRASNGTRINSAGLVEVVPWNLLENTDTFSSWDLEGGTLTSGFTAPDGSSTAYKYVQIPGGGLYSGSGGVTADVKFAQVWIKSVSGGSITCNISDGAAFFGTLNVTGEWQLFTAPYTANSRIGLYLYAISNASGIYVWHPQVNIGSTAKPYFPTTDRLNVPRLTYQNGGGGCPSLLLEPQRTNIFPNSQTTANWSFTNMSRTANYGISPDGTQNADLLSPTTSGSVTFQSDITTSSLVIGQPFVVSFFIKLNASFTSDAGTNILDIRLSGPTVWSRPTVRVNLETGEVTSINNAIYISSTNFGNGWFRITFGATPTGTSGQVALQSPTSVTMNGGSFYIWGLQGEANATYATSYIPSQASSATRVADVCTKNGIGALIGGTSGTVFFDIKTNPVLSSASYKQFCYYFDSASAQSYMYLNSANQLSTNSNWGSFVFATPLVANTRYKIALVYAPNDFALYVNGVSVATASSGTPKDNADITIGQLAGTEYCEFVFNQYTHFPSRLTNAELASLTTI